jgi:acetate---CoA ligase (ADP-forming)
MTLPRESIFVKRQALGYNRKKGRFKHIFPMSLHTLFAPRSVALVGASTNEGSVGHDIAKNLVRGDYGGEVFFVNPKATELLGRPCYPSLAAVPGTVELVIIAVPAAIVPAILRAAGEKQVRAAVIISAGFKESGSAGKLLEEEVIEIARDQRITLLGPNCLGFINPARFLNASFASSIPANGSIAFFSQSGALTSAFLDLARGRLGFSTFVSIGNKATLGEAELLEYFLKDEATRSIGFYTEGLSDAGRLIQLGRSLVSLDQPKPVVVLKSGSTEAGTHASSSHTGAVAGSDAAYDALFRQARMLRAGSFSELIDWLAVGNGNPLPRGGRLAIVTNAGGLGVLSTDAAVKSGLSLATLAPTTVEKLRAVLPPAANVLNPIDVLGDALAERYEQALRIVAADPGVDMLLVILTPQTMTDAAGTAAAIARVRAETPTLAWATVFSGNTLVAPGHTVLAKAGIPNILYPEAGARALGALARVAMWKHSLSDTPTTLFPVDAAGAQAERERARQDGLSQLGEYQASVLLEKYGFPFLEHAFVTTSEEATAFARTLGKPLALKIASPDIIHKSDVGGVLLDVEPERAGAAFEHLLATVRQHVPDAHIDGAVASAMAQPGGIELLLGLKKEPDLGTLVVLGLGGIYVETFRDIAMRFAPLLPSDIDEMLSELQSFPLLTGARGRTSIDLGRLRELVARLSQLAVDMPEIAELDLNPLLVFPEGDDFRILDARIRFED